MSSSHNDYLNKIGIVGAGAIGSVCGLSLARKNNSQQNTIKRKIVLVGRQSLLKAVQANGGTLRLHDKVNNHSRIETFHARGTGTTTTSKVVTVTDNLHDLQDCSLIIVATKTTATKSIAESLAKILPRDSSSNNNTTTTTAATTTTIVSFQNGVRNAAILQEALHHKQRVQVFSSMVNFNATWDLESNTFCKNTDGGVKLEQPNHDDNDNSMHYHRIKALARAMTQNNLPSFTASDIQPVLYSKLLVNLFNAINALAGVSTPSTLEQKGYRRVWAAAITEGLEVYRQQCIVPASIRGLPPSLLPLMKFLPDFLFWFILRRVLKMADTSKSSMLQDLERHRPQTEIDDLCGEIVRLGQAANVPTPVNAALVRLVQAAQEARKGSPCLSAKDLLVQVGLESC